MNFQRRLSQVTFGLVVLLLGAQQLAAQAPRSEEDLPLLDLNTPLRLNFAGSWEKDFARSDKWEDELNRVLQMRQEQAALQRAGVGGGSAPRVSLGNLNLNSGRRGANLFELAQLAEYINRQTTMEITQDRNEIRIERRGEAPLVCSLEMGPMSTFSSAHGTEICGWDLQQLVFEITLPEDLVIRHRFSVAADGEELRMVTSVSSKGSAPFNLITAFNRYDAGPDNLNCVLTVSRGRVCSQVTPLD
ncbi:MAG: hypothetical protein MI746_08885 [Pseudomonadales bacterium]|nr:hypothetical protein [Pseudomonadales bacterium]